MATNFGSKNINGYFKTIPEGIDANAIDNAKPIDVGNLAYVTSVFTGGGISDGSWQRDISGYLRPYIITDKVIIGGSTFTTNEIFSVIGKSYADQSEAGEMITPLLYMQDGNYSSQISTVLSGDRTVLLPDKDGTIAFTDDITAVNWTDVVDRPSSSTSAIDGAVTNSHTHSNKSLLDTYTQSNANIASAISNTHYSVTIGSTTSIGLYLSDLQEISLRTAGSETDGAITSADWNYFNNKQPVLGYNPENIANKNIPGGYPGLDYLGKINPLNIPALSTGTVYVVADETAMLALTANVGDVAKQTTSSIKVYILQVQPATVIGNWVDISTSMEQVYNEICSNGTTDITLGSILTYSKFEVDYSATIAGKIRSEVITIITDGSDIILGLPGYISLPDGDDCGLSFADPSINSNNAVLTIINSNVGDLIFKYSIKSF